MSRYVLVVPRDCGGKYIRVISRYRVDKNFVTTIREFLKRSHDFSYFQLFRTAFEIDVITQETTNTVSVYSVNNRGVETRHYCVQREMRDNVVIGTVKFGDHTVDDRTDGLVRREVTWEGGLDKPRITIFSRYNDGTEAKYRYMFMNENSKRFFVFEETRGLVNLFN
ncbi:hypothetical protein BEWA_045520 [Theileria equi strain WA]|uniref:Uncharacterized protein n=1 Tax=Theileria equi strain WA TaxID=1537102 RepID=L1LA88_THEEQ|nr:hypothetical protein BEWA_045520 [Theileria equi strain WA]EKX72088.1 hypothetical protein BEWA_045520 [Theileria equi strain WA]|eukprot:XP_004831540.1 hypothetical protein BEWA_045520 [Theileria equi strain WA]